MFERFSAQAREALVLAQAEASRLRHPWLGTEHLLLALLRQPGTPASRLLAGLDVTTEAVERQLIEELGEPCGDPILGEEDDRALGAIGIDLREVRRRVEETFGPGALERARPGRCGWPMMPRLKESLQRACGVAGQGFVETDDLLLGMLQVRGALAVELLTRLRVTPYILRERIQAQRARAR